MLREGAGGETYDAKINSVSNIIGYFELVCWSLFQASELIWEAW